MWSDTRRRLTSRTALAVAAAALGTVAVVSAAEQRVDWTNLANVSVRGGSLQKTNGCDGCDDATAVSRQMIRSGDGYAEWTVGEPYTFWMAGLSQSDGDAHFNNIDFAIRFNGNDTADVVENGQYQGGDTDYAAGDRFRVAVEGGRVRYMKNNRVIFESRQGPRRPLVFEVAFGTMGASLRNARIDTNNRAFTNNDYYYEPGRNARGTSGQLITVSPTERWTDTGIWVEAGDMITFDAEGSIQMSDNAGDTATPQGSRSGRRAADAPLRNQPAGLLLARIGNSATVAVGGRRTARAPVSGELYLGVNDDFLGDNRGEYRVSVTVESR